MAEQPLQASVPEPAPAPFDVVALVASAGGLDALSTVLRDLPPNFAVAVLVAQHLGGQGRALVEVLSRRTQLPVSWIQDGDRIEPGHVHVCPPRMRLEVLPDEICSLSPAEGALEYPLNFFLESLADSFGSRALAVILTGMGKDAAAGAYALRQAGGTVIVQSEDTAEHPSMPHAAIESGAASLVLPLHEIGPVITNVMAGGRFPRPQTEIDAADALFAGPGEVPRLLREIDWAQTPLGPVSGWPASLRMALRLVLESPMPMIVLWGLDNIQLYNDHYRLLMGEKHPAGLGQPNRECWPEVWHFNQPIYTQIFEGKSVARENALLSLFRHGAPEDAWFNLYFTPIHDEQGAVGGVLSTVLETTTEVLAERRLRTLNVLASATAGATTLREAFQQALASLGENNQDIPFAMGYLLDGTRLHATLCAAAGLELGSPAAPHTINLGGGHPAWPLARVIHEGAPVILEDLVTRFRGFHAGSWLEATTTALLFPLRVVADEPPVGVLILGISPRLAFTERYRTFLELVTAQVSAGLAAARVRQQERERIEQLAELDHAKTEFFSNVSHEFRTPLTLLLGPLDELLSRREDLPAHLGDEMEVATRNARRLLNLVNTLLDFSRLEAGRLHAHFEPTDLATFTVELVSVFRSAVDRAGLQFRVDCPTLPEAVWVDREMWEKIISNLLSNALKFTFEGEIAVEMHALPQHAELVVRDTGVGIPQAELPHLFKRFHRVRGTRARTFEGSGIGLAQVHELVRLHHGRVRVQSKEGQGTTFTIWIPLGARVVADPSSGRLPFPKPQVAVSLAEEALHWSTESGGTTLPPTDLLNEALSGAGSQPPPARAPGARVLLVDDNADMRVYLRRVLAPYWEVEAALDGAQALALAQRIHPDLILADAMMPTLDGFGLLQRVREDKDLQSTPVILVTARAGEEAAIEGLLAGADDYVTKPFSARELVARVSAQLELARVRHESEAQFRSLITATSEVVYKMSPDWSEMRYLNGKAFIADTEKPRRTWLETYIPSQDQARVVAVIQEAIRTKGVFELEHRVIRVDGSVGWMHARAVPLLDARGEIVEWLGAASDITARVEAEQELLRAREELVHIAERKRSVSVVEHEQLLKEVEKKAADLETMIDTMVDAVSIYDAQGKVVRVNPAAVILFGFDPLDDQARVEKGRIALKHLDGMLVQREDLPIVRALAGQVVKGERYLYTNAVGREFIIEASVAPLWDGDTVRGAVANWSGAVELPHLDVLMQHGGQAGNSATAE